MILDTAFVIDMLDGDEGAVRKARELEHAGTPQRLSAITIFELHFGVERSARPDAEKDRVLSVVDSKPVVSADARIMRKAGHLHGHLTNEGTPIGERDSIIGATAIIQDETVLSRDDHFEIMPGVRVETY